MDSYEQFASYLRETKNIVVLTGAGMSTESGIPDFRSPTGLWTYFDPEEYATIEAFYKDPAKVWKLFIEIYKTLKNSKPNRGHYYLAEIEQWKRKITPNATFTVITQNVDGFHQQAGSTDVIEIHGDANYAECMTCHKKYLMEKVLAEQHELPPRCECSGILKQTVILFGEMLPPEALQRAQNVSKKSDLFIVLGSSLVVSPANWFVLDSDGKKVLVNLQETLYDSVFDLIFHERISDVLGTVLSKLK